MKKQLFNVLLCSLLPLTWLHAQSTVAEGQSTEGKDFWVTFMQADQDDNNSLQLQLSISSREDCSVTIDNPFTSYSETVNVTAGEMKLVTLYSGNVLSNNARTAMASTGKVCYAVNSEKVDTCALHVTSTKNISLFATNYKKATFDATNVLPTASLLDEYYIQTYTPSDHGGTSSTQGSHFAIIAAEDNTVVEYVPTVETKSIRDFLTQYNNWGDDVFEMYPQYERFRNFHAIGDTILSDTLMAGQVYYVWTGKKDGENGDLSGTYVKARDGKKIAVFQGCPHTNIPYQVKQRDHIFSQAMPTQYWGNTFVLTASASRPADFIRVLALHDGTEVRINGNLVHTFNFATDTKHYWEFQIGEQGSYAQNGSCVVTTSCACAVHLFMASQQYHGDKNSNGDPAMLWINPIEQQIDQVTFATYASSNGTTSHYVNVVTDKPNLMTLDDNGAIATQFKAVSGSSTYYYAQISLGSTAASHTLKSNGSNFIAHVYGFTENESYGYSAGGATKSLNQSIYINGQEFTPDSENSLCGKDTVHFACKPDFMPDSIKWHFGDGSADVMVYDTTTIVPHYYNGTQDYNASCTIYRSSSNLCVGQSAETVINILVTIGRYTFTIGEAKIPCPVNGVQGPGTIPYTSSINLIGDTAVKVDFDTAAKEAGFTKNDLKIKPDQFELNIPSTAEPGVKYGIQIEIHSDCGDTIAVLPFALPVGNDVIDQRYNNVLGLIKDHKSLKGLSLSDFQWYRASDSTALVGQVTSNLNMYDLPESDYKNDEFYICYWVNKGQADAYYNCACAKPFITDSTHYQFGTSPDSLIISASYSYQHGEKVFVNANWGGKTDIECYAQWITTDGRIYKDLKFNIPNGGCTIDTPAEPGLYMLRVVTEKKTRSFKFIIQ